MSYPFYALDCLPIVKNKKRYSDRRLGSISKEGPGVRQKQLLEFHKELTEEEELPTLFGKKKNLRDNPLIYLNHENGLWTAGRFIGTAIYKNANGTTYKITIEPRFGREVLEWLLTQSLDIRITPSLGRVLKKRDDLYTVILAYLWVHYLAKANRYGLPRVKKTRYYKGNKIRERLDVRKSAVSYKTEREVVSSYRVKQVDPFILQLLKQTHDYLERDGSLALITKPDNAKDALQEINAFADSRNRFTGHDYKQIKLGSVYQNYQKVIDMSWNILRGMASQEILDDGKDVALSTFIDMAEIWENFLRTALKKGLQEKGWHLYTNDIHLYSDSEPLGRRIIPDIVFIKGNKAIVLDAKYKLMRGSKKDLDRTDFFQIHTYMSYFIEQGYDVIGGLIYPLTIETNSNLDTKSYNLLGSKKKNSKIFVEGMKLDFETEDSKELANYLNDEKKGLVDRLLEKVSE